MDEDTKVDGGRRAEKIREEYAVVLDYLPNGSGSMPMYKRVPVAQTVGEHYFVLLEVSPKDEATFDLHERVYVGDGERPKVKTIRRRVRYDELSNTSKKELEEAIEQIIETQEQRFVDFYNKSRAISLKHHQLELLPKIGKKHLISILDEREIEPFKSFKDINARVKGMPDAKELVTERVLEEIEGKELDHRLFVPDFGKEDEERNNRRGHNRRR